jgi:hypothetical protein
MPYASRKKRGGTGGLSTQIRVIPEEIYGDLADLASRHREELSVNVPVKTYHGRPLKSIICKDCGYQNINKVHEGKCLEIPACLKRQKAWR